MSRIEEIRRRVEAGRDVSASKQSVSAIAQMAVDRKRLLAEVDRLRAEKAAVAQERDAYKLVKEYWDGLYGEGLEVANWHKNGDLEPFDSFWEAAEEEYGYGMQPVKDCSTCAHDGEDATYSDTPGYRCNTPLCGHPGNKDNWTPRGVQPEGSEENV